MTVLKMIALKAEEDVSINWHTVGLLYQDLVLASLRTAV
jgi:hypothetical protein